MRRSRAVAPGGPVVIDGFSDLVAIGSGGFSMVYRAHELALDRAVAVKVLNTGLTSERERRDFERECKVLGQLNHPDVVTVYRPAFTTDGRPCIVMALYERNFRDHLDASGPLPPAELLDVGIRMAVALHVAHRRGVLHRDVKPHNIFRSVYGDPALGDFGISTLAGERSHDRSTALSLAYVAPEILDDAPPSARADVYSLGATLHHLATGRAPFEGKEPSRVVNQVLHDEPPALERSDLPASFQRALRMAMAKNPGQRPTDARGFAEVLREVQARAGHPPTALKLDTDEARTVAPVVFHDDGGVASTGVREGRERRRGASPPPVPPPPVPPPPASLPPAPLPPAGGAIRDVRTGAAHLTSPDAPPPALPPGAAIPDVRTGAAHLESADAPGPPTQVSTPTPAPRSDIETTVVRRAPAAPFVEPEEAGPSRRRVWIGSALAVVAVAAVIVVIAAVRGGSSSTTATTVVASAPPPDSFFTPLAVPPRVTVTQAAGGGFAVYIPEVPGATSYEIERTTGGDVVTVTPDQLPTTIDDLGATTVCVVVRALGADGRVSRDGGPFCSA